jgi:hypothetical protein
MARVVEEASSGLPVRIESIDIDLDAELAGHYGEEIPVLLVNGRKFAKFRVSEARLRYKLLREALRVGEG